MNAVEVRQVVIVRVAPVHVSNRTGIVLFYIPEQNPDPLWYQRGSGFSSKNSL